MAPIHIAYHSGAFTIRLTDGLERQEAPVVIQFHRTIGTWLATAFPLALLD
ncbi:MAG: hypothetical protein KAT23_08935 [Anaerolineales bacterium]|nr:hypothetical protein [Anaerolineales bacterium]